MSCDSKADLVRFGTGRGVEEHVSDRVEVNRRGGFGVGSRWANRGERALSAGVLAFIPQGALCAIVSTSEGFA